jgi:protein arginine kinase activator
MPGHCDRCENPATVHLTEIKGGQKTERHLCEKCAASLHVPSASKELAKLLKSFEPALALATQGTTVARTCPECGMTYAEFRQHGRFGCARDYEVFGEQVEKLLRRIHGGARYAGKKPGGGAVHAPATRDDILRVRGLLDEAVKAENYEEAARLRDQIRRLTEEPEEGRSGGTAP